MIDFSLEFANVMIPYAAALVLKLYPMWKTRDVKTRSVVVYSCCFTLYICVGLFMTERVSGLDFNALQYFKLFASLPHMLVLFWVFRKRFWQNIFLLAISYMYGPISVGVGMYAGANWFTSSAYPLLASNLVSLAVIALTLPPLLFLLRRLCENPDMKRTGVWRFIWILPALFFCVFLLSGSPFDIENFHGNGFLVIRAIIYAAALLTCFLLETSLRQVSENISLKENARLIENRIEQQEEQFNLIAENTNKALQARHDLRQHLSTLRGLLDAGNLVELERYLSEYAVGHAGDIDVAFCWNARVNALLCHYAAKAKELGADVRISIDMPRESGISDLDLCVVIGNCFENAVAACIDVPLDKRHISLKCVEVTGSLMILLDNSFNGKPPVKQDGRFLSSKHDGLGIGLASVMSVAEKYGGMAEFTTVGDEFRSEVELRMPDA